MGAHIAGAWSDPRGAMLVRAPATAYGLIGETASGARPIELAAALQPDLVLVDVRDAEMDGIETARRMPALIPEAVIVLISVGEIPDAAWLAPGVAACPPATRCSRGAASPPAPGG
jgi:CheY-like chemotaxis protein